MNRCLTGLLYHAVGRFTSRAASLPRQGDGQRAVIPGGQGKPGRSGPGLAAAADKRLQQPVTHPPSRRQPGVLVLLKQLAHGVAQRPQPRGIGEGPPGAQAPLPGGEVGRALVGDAGQVQMINNYSVLQSKPRRMPNFWMVKPAG